MNTLSLILLGSIGAYFLANKNSSSINSIATKNKIKIIQSKFPGYEIKNNKIIISNKKEALEYAFKIGFSEVNLKNTSTERLNHNHVGEIAKYLFGMTHIDDTLFDYRDEKLISIYNSNPNFIYWLWLSYSAGYFKKYTDKYNNFSDESAIISIPQFIFFLDTYEIKMDFTFFKDLDSVLSNTEYIIYSPSYPFPGYRVYPDEKQSVIIYNKEKAFNYAFQVGKNNFDRVFTYLFGVNAHYKMSNLSVDTKEKALKIYTLLIYAVAGFYSNKKVSYEDIINFLKPVIEVFNKNNYEIQYPNEQELDIIINKYS